MGQCSLHKRRQNHLCLPGLPVLHDLTPTRSVNKHKEHYPKCFRGATHRILPHKHRSLFPLEDPLSTTVTPSAHLSCRRGRGRSRRRRMRKKERCRRRVGRRDAMHGPRGLNTCLPAVHLHSPSLSMLLVTDNDNIRRRGLPYLS